MNNSNIHFLIALFSSLFDSSRDEIFKFLKEQIIEKDEGRLRELFEFLSAKELRHIDFLIYLIGYYKSAAPYLLKAIMEILMEDERALQQLMKNFG